MIHLIHEKATPQQIPLSQQVRYESLINIAPHRHNFSMTIQDEAIQRQVKTITEQLLGGV